MSELKAISPSSIPRAQEKAHRYRLLNEPREAESICRDILHTDPDDQAALITLLLALTDQFGKEMKVSVNHAREVLPRIDDPYRRKYYDGVICERWAKAQYLQKMPGYVIYDWIRQAMDRYLEAEAISPEDNDDAILRWNTCVRILKRNSKLAPLEQDQSIAAGYEDEVPFR